MTLESFLQQQPFALAFSGGVDSAYLLYLGKKLGCQFTAYFVNSVFQPGFELEDAKKLCAQLDAPLKILEGDILSFPDVVKNPKDRCYYCKNAVFSLIQHQAEKDGYRLIIDGTNASDDASDRPGMKALAEMSVQSPLRLFGYTKDKIRQASKEAGLFTHNKPSYACLATRIPTNTPITAEDLSKVEKAENFLFEKGFTDFRVRLLADGAKIQVPEEQMAKVLAHRTALLAQFSPLFSQLYLDLTPRNS